MQRRSVSGGSLLVYAEAEWLGERREKGLMGLARDINWDIVLFMLSIFIVVQGLETAGVTNLLASALVTTSKLPSVLGVFAPSMVVTVGASFMNNWPMTILGLLSIHQAAVTGPALTNLVFSNIIGNNLGPHFFPLGFAGDFDVAGNHAAQRRNHQPKRIPQSRRNPIHCPSCYCFASPMGRTCIVWV